jgi:hypothetical protein
MGWIWEFFMGKDFILSSIIKWRLFFDTPKISSYAETNYLKNPQIGYLFDYFELKKNEIQISSTSISSYSFKAKSPEFCNPVDTMHGGAIAMIGEYATILSFPGYIYI